MANSLSDQIVWASGSNGTYLRTIDGGNSWNYGVIVDSLDFRDIHAFDENRAVVLSAGSPALIFLTEDGGDTWDLRYENHDPRIFFDAMDFGSETDGIAFADAIDGYFHIITSNDGGRNWDYLKSSPSALSNEGGFAASGTNMIITTDGTILIGTTAGRLLQSSDNGFSWSSEQSLLESTESTAGIFSLAEDNNHIVMCWLIVAMRSNY